MKRQLATLLAEGDLKVDPNRNHKSTVPDEDEQPLNEMNQVITSRRNRQRALEVQRIKAALERLDEDPDEFGHCQDCEEPIAPGRLEIMPWALRCVRCESGKGNPRDGRRRHLTDFIE